MTARFDSEQQALDIGLLYAGVLDKKESILENVSPEEMFMDFPQAKAVNTYTFPNENGVPCTVGIGQFRDGYDLWLIDESGFSRRV